MDDLSTTDNDGLTLAHSVASILGIKGALRFRPHGSTQKPHVVLRRVAVSDDSSDDGEVSNVIRFSLFAQKRIEVKPGKEILLSVAASNGPFKEQPVVLEGDLVLPEDISDEEGATQVADEEDTLLPPIEQAIPPKMRRAWTRKNEDTSHKICPPDQPARRRLSVSVQVEPTYVQKSIQSELPISTASVSVQADPSGHLQKPVDGQFRRFTDAEVQTDPISAGGLLASELGSCNIPSSLGSISGERSLSPMELDSAPASPELSPHSSPPYSPGALPLDSSMITQPDISPPLPLSLSSLLSRRKLQQIQSFSKSNSPLDSSSIASSSGGNPQQSISHTSKVGQDQQVMVASSKPKLEEPETQSLLTSESFSYIDVDTAGNSPARPGKPSVHNPFVSAGFLTEFVNPVKRPSEVESSIAEQRGVEVAESKSLTVPGSLDSQVVTSISSPTDVALPLTKTHPIEPSPRPQSSAASSSKIPLGKATPTKPMHYLRLSSSRAFEKSPAVSGTSIPQRRVDQHLKFSPPPDLRSLTYISTGPSSNPLNIRPSSSFGLQGGERPIPTAPKTLAQATTKKRVIVGAGWTPVKATQTTGQVTPLATSSAPLPIPSIPTPALSSVSLPVVDRLTNTISKRSSSPPLVVTPLTATPQPKWKRVFGETDVLTQNGNLSKTHLVNGTPDVKGDPENRQITHLPEKPQATPLKGRMTSENLVPFKFNGRDLRGRISNVVALSSSRTSSPLSARRDHSPQLLSPISPMVHRSFGHSNSTPPLPSPVTPANPPLNHPLPPKPIVSSQGSNDRGIKRERANSPDRSRKKRRIFRWPTVDSNYSTKLVGDGQVGICSIAFNSDGSLFALCCADRTVRIWNSRSKTEIARLAHNAPILSVVWTQGDMGVISLAEDGLISKWTRTGVNHWHWSKVLDAGKSERRAHDHICLAYARDRIAVSFPRTGVKVWVWMKGNWHPQRSILRQNVTAIKFVNEGAALIGGTRDGVLWHCDVPNGILRAFAFLQRKIQSLDLTPSKSPILVAAGAHAKIVTMEKVDVEKSFSCVEIEARPSDGFGAIFATEGQAVLFGAVDGCVLVWDRKSGAIVYGLEHDEDDDIQAVASFDGPTNRDGFLITGTKKGQLSWWSQPVAAPQGMPHPCSPSVSAKEGDTDDASKQTKPAV